MTVGPDYFDSMYRDDPDPWGFEDRWYEQRKHALTLASLPAPHYRRGFEPGCANGVLTEGLAGRVDELEAWEPHDGAAARAAERLAHLPNVTVECAAIPRRWPSARFDLIVVSEVAYYLDDDDLTSLVLRIGDALVPGADLVAVHWVGETNYPQTAAGTHEALACVEGVRLVAHHEDDGFLLDVWQRR